jgi:signal recognition particle subunit SRP54
MFESLSDKLGGVFDSLRGKKKLSEDDVNVAAREIRMALLEADVALPVVKDFIQTIKDQAIGQDIIKSVSPTQQIIKIVNDAMVGMLGGTEEETLPNINAPAPAAFLMVGLQGSGKTTSSGKIAKLLTDKYGKKILMASLDVYRPAAQKQLAVLGEQTNVDTLPILDNEKPTAITKRALEQAKLGGYDIVILDSAGRLSIDNELMDEISQVAKIAKPAETLLVADAMTGQDAVNVAKAFDDQISISGIVLTRVDGDARGGAAMSMRGITGKPLKFLGIGEKVTDIEVFHADRVASRILGMGDVVSLVEKAAETIDQQEAEKMAAKFKKGDFDLDDFAKQLKQLRSMGGMGAMMKMLPGLGKMSGMMDKAGMDDGAVQKQEAMLSSMTLEERSKPQLLNASRKRRIANGSGTSVQDLNKLLKQFTQMQKMMRQMKKMGMGGMMKAMKGMMGGNPQMDQLMNEMEGQMTGDQGTGLENANASQLGPNPFLGGNAGGLPQGLPPELMGGLGGMGGGKSKSSFTKSQKSKRKKKK